MQLRFATDLSAQQYVRQQAWKDAQLDNCPLHPKGGCGFARHGTYWDGVGPSQHAELTLNTPKSSPEICPISPFLGVK